MQSLLNEQAESPSAVRRWVPGAFVAVVLLAVLIGLAVTVSALLLSHEEPSSGEMAVPQPIIEPDPVVVDPESEVDPDGEVDPGSRG